MLPGFTKAFLCEWPSQVMFVTQPTLHDRRQPTQPCCSPSHSLVFNCSHAGYCTVWNGAPAGAPTYPLQSSIFPGANTIWMNRTYTHPKDHSLPSLRPWAQLSRRNHNLFQLPWSSSWCPLCAQCPRDHHTYVVLHLCTCPSLNLQYICPHASPPGDPACSYQWSSVSL